jgi:nucleotide-binding universal stress UspA family protein
MEPLFRHILVPIDGSEPSLAAARMAVRLVLVCPTGRLTALHVVDKLVVTELVRFGSRDANDVHAELEQHGKRYLELVSADAARQGVALESQTRRGDPFEEIVGAANELGADLIAMGHTGRRGTARVLIGSVTQRVLDYSPCPVLVMRG